MTIQCDSFKILNVLLESRETRGLGVRGKQPDFGRNFKVLRILRTLLFSMIDRGGSVLMVGPISVIVGELWPLKCGERGGQKYVANRMKWLAVVVEASVSTR